MSAGAVTYRRGALALLAGCTPMTAAAQRTQENAVTVAGDAFGTSVGKEVIGLYNANNVRGFSPVTAGNIRLDGLYFTQRGLLNERLLAGADIRVGISSMGYPFPAPTGIVDYRLRPIGDDTLVSAVLSRGPFTGTGLDVDAQLAIDPALGIALGASARREVDQPGGDDARHLAVAIAPRWRPNSSLELRPFWGRFYAIDDTTTPYIFVEGPHLPLRFRRRSYAQGWAGWDARFDSYGLIGRADLGRWQVRLGLSAATERYDESYNDLYLDTGADGIARRHVVNAYPVNAARASSGEARISRSIASGRLHHNIHFSLKHYALDRTYGGTDSVDFGPQRAGAFVDLDKPDFRFTEFSAETVKQQSAGVGYHGLWSGIGELSLGLQKLGYSKRTLAPLRPALVTKAEPWIWNGTIALHLAKNLVAYAGYTRGLEESAVAPEIALNRSEAPPAIRTSQRDAGIRYALTPTLRLVAGVFDVRKPYFNLGRDLIYRNLGDIRHKGIEVSLAGELAAGVNAVAGAVLMKPRISGEAVETGLIGEKPVGQTGRTLRFDADYRPHRTHPLSVDMSLVHFGPRTASLDNRLSLPAITLLNLGGRYRFKLMDNPAMLRLLIENLTDRYTWSVSGSGGFRPEPQRRMTASLALDL